MFVVSCFVVVCLLFGVGCVVFVVLCLLLFA